MNQTLRYPGSFWHRAGCLQAIRDRRLLSMLSPEEQCAFVSEVADGRPLEVVVSIAARRDAAERNYA